MANMVCLNAAIRAQAGWDVRAKGVAAGKPLVVYASAEVHTWLQKGVDLCGLGTEAMRSIPVDDSLAMRGDALMEAIAKDRADGRQPAVVVGTAGSVSTGAVDPLSELADLCAREGIWFHVDGAYGAPAAVLSDAPAELRAIARADSVAVDPHKWLYAPLEAGCALVRDPEKLRAAFAYHPPYYHFDEHATNYVDYGPQNSRGFRALKIWLALRQVGAAGYRRMIGDDIRLSRAMADAVARYPELQLMTQDLSITTFRYVPVDLRTRLGEDPVERHLDALNRELLDGMQRGGEAFVSNAVIGGRYVLRACIVNFHTNLADVEAVPAVAVRLGRALDAQTRPEALHPNAG
jgi:glutamate/tyrosine decarboxylase-like PLP-dependent enzyme